MKAAIVATGDEVLRAEIVNTTTPYLIQSLIKAGLEPIFTLSSGDDEESIGKSLLFALNQADIVITTGGLGPTQHDKTREAVAKALNLKLEENQEVVKSIKDYFDKIGLEPPEINFRQAFVIQDSLVLQNDFGTAPGLLIKKGEKMIILLPGPPRELKPMWEKQILPGITNNQSQSFSTDIHLYGISESAMAEKIGEELSRTVEPLVAPYPSIGHIILRMWGNAKNEKNWLEKIYPIQYKIRTKLTNHVFDDVIEATLGKLLKSKNLSLSTAESCTGGLVSKTITDVSGSSDYFLGGVNSYSNRSKIDLLDVSSETLDSYGAVSELVAREMVLGVKNAFKSDCAISTTGIAGPGGATPDKPVGLVFIGIAWPGGVKVIRRIFAGSRQDIRQRTNLQSLFELVLELRKL